MKRFTKKLVGALFITLGIMAVVWGGYETLQARWSFFILVVYGIGMILAGWVLISGKAFKEFFEALYDIFR